MKKLLKIFAITAALIAVFGMMTATAADEIEVYVNDTHIEFDVSPRIINDRTMIPFRYVANTFGAEVNYREEADGTKIVTAVQGDKTLLLTIGNTCATLIENGNETELAFDTAPVIVDSRTLVPIRLIGEAFGCSVGWNGDEKQVIIIDSADYAEKIKTAEPEFYENILCHDLTKISGTYDVTLGTVDDCYTLELTADGKAVAISFEYGSYVFDIIVTSEAIYAKEATLTRDKWELTPLEDLLNEYGPAGSSATIDGQMLVSFIVDTYMDSIIPTAGTFSEINTFIDTLLAGVSENFVLKTENHITTANYSATIPAGGDTLTFTISKTTNNNIIDDLSVGFVSADENLIFKMKITDKAKTIVIPTADEIITE